MSVTSLPAPAPHLARRRSPCSSCSPSSSARSSTSTSSRTTRPSGWASTTARRRPRRPPRASRREQRSRQRSTARGRSAPAASPATASARCSSGRTPRPSAVPRTSPAGSTIAGTTIEAATFTVDLTTVSSDESTGGTTSSEGRIMDTATYPTATFELTERHRARRRCRPMARRSRRRLPASSPCEASRTRSPSSLRARLIDGAIEVTGSIPVTFADYEIPDASFGPATVQDSGEVEFLLVLAPS